MAARESGDQEPVDSDIFVDDTPSGAARPAHLRGGFLALVALGGAVGTGLRELLSLAWPSVSGGFPLAIFVINIVGAFVLGALLEFLARRGPDHGHRRALRLLFGTGMLGGFTTYSSFATGAALLIGTSLDIAFGYAAATLVAGFIASAFGIAVGSRLHRWSAREVTE